MAAWPPLSACAQTPTVALVQHASKDAGTTTSATLAFNANNTAGDWIGVCIRAGQSGQIFTVTDSKGNTYHKAVQFNVTVDGPGGDTLGIFYAENIAGGANTISVSDTIPGTMRFAILEYSGIATGGSLDVATAAQGSSANPNSGNVTTTTNGDLLLGAITTGSPANFTVGSGYASEESVPGAPNTKLNVEDGVQSIAGTALASASLGGFANWGAALAAFRVAGGGPAPTPTVPLNLRATATSSAQITLSWGAATENGGTITGYAIERCQGSGCVNFGQIATPTGTTYNDMGLVPSTSYSYRIRARDAGGNLSGYSSTASAIATMANGAIALVQHASKDAGTTTSATLAFNANNTAGDWIGVCIRAGQSGQIFTVTDSKGNTYHKAVQFNVTVDGPGGDTLGIFYAENIAGGANTISVSDTIPGTMRFAILEYSGIATGGSLDVATAAQGSSANPNSGNVTTTTNGDLLLGAITTGSPANFTVGSGYASEESVPGAPNTKLNVEDGVQSIAGTALASASLGGFANWGAALAAFRVAGGVGNTGPSITSLSPTSGPFGTSVTITGTNFGTLQGTSTVKFNTTTAIVTSWSNTSIVAIVPNGSTTGNVVSIVSGVASNGMSFTVLPSTDTTAPTVAITAPASNAAVSGTITVSATASDPDSAVSFVQFLVDGANVSAQLTSSPYSVSLDTTMLSNTTHTLIATTQDPAGNQGTSTAVSITVSNSIGGLATGPLKVLASNPRYFTDGSGKAIYLTGSHTWANLVDQATSDPPSAFDYTAYLNFLQAHNHNFFRLWTWTLPHANDVERPFTTPLPWLRTGPGIASDSKPQFDLNQFDQTYFNRLRSRVIAAGQNGIYVSIMLFEGFDLQFMTQSNDGDPFAAGNNVNGVSCGGTCPHTLPQDSTVTGIEQAYLRKVVDTVNDLDNVLYEVANEAGPYSTSWQYSIIEYVKQYEATKLKQHPVGMTFQYLGGADSALYASPADWISPVDQLPPPADGRKVVVNDTDHAYGWGRMRNDGPAAQQQWAWENFAIGNNTLFMDPYLVVWPRRNAPGPTTADPYWEVLRNALGRTRVYAQKMNLAGMTPQSSLSSTGFCLANSGLEYLVYQPSSGAAFNVNLTSGTYSYEWYDPSSGVITATGFVTASGGNQSFMAPFGGDAVLYLKHQ